MEDNETSSQSSSDKNSEVLNLVCSDKATQQSFLCRNTDKIICMRTWKKA